jgi:hypothetical protein
MEISQYIRENNARKRRFTREYNPYTGVGSLIPRKKVNLIGVGEFFLPRVMMDIPTVDSMVKNIDMSNKKDLNLLWELRLKHDFEFYAFVTQSIKHKITGKNIPFTLNYPQRTKLLPALEEMRTNGCPIRIVLVKARQWGGSTLVNAYGNWIQSQHRTGWNSCIVTDVESQALTIRGMYTNIAKNYPVEIGTVTLTSFEGSSKNRLYVERDCVISIGSAQKPDSLRSSDIKIAHLSECGLWKKTQGKKPDDLAQSIRGTVPKLPYTMIVLESTAKGVGNFFHDEYLSAIKDDTDYKMVFVAWWEIEMYQVKTVSNIEDFISSWGEREKYLWSLGATIEGIYWYKDYLNSEMKMDTWRMSAEFPSTPEEAFQSTGRRVFPPSYINGMRKYTRKPEYVGDIYPQGISDETCLEKISFHQSEHGEMLVWALPDKTEAWVNRYLTVMDIGGRHAKADYSVVRVLDRYLTAFDSKPEVVATWRGHLDYDLVAWKAVQIAKYYNNSELVVESNYIDNKGDYDESGQFVTILDQIADHYDNLYTRTRPENISEGTPTQYGFHTNKHTKPVVISTLLKFFRMQHYIEPYYKALDEADTYEVKQNGSYGAVEGCHDDVVMATAIMLWRHTEMDRPYMLKRTQRRTRNNNNNESSF